MKIDSYPSLALVRREFITTDEAAYYLNRRPQTLRSWAMDGRVINPRRVNGRLAWPVSEIRKLLGFGDQT